MIIRIFLFLLLFVQADGFDKVVIWGHKLHTHTHSYIHNGFYQAFKNLGYKTFWLDDNDDVSQFNFANSLFLTEGQVDGKIPLRDDCCYLIHNCRQAKYHSAMQQGRCISFQVYTDDVMKVPHIVKAAPCIYYDIPGKAVYMPWATDLLPHQINQIKEKIPAIQKQTCIYWVGTIGAGDFGNINELSPFMTACQENGLQFIHKDPWHKGTSVQDNIHYISTSYLAPAIVGSWQNKAGYIPCRIFKNISYGQMGITNSYRTYELFEGKIVYNPDTYQLFFDAERRIKSMQLQELYDLMDFVRENHTFLNRINTLLDFLSLVKSSI